MDPKQDLHEIVGVVGDVRELGLDQEVAPTMYGVETGPVMTLVLKTAAGFNPSAAAVREAIHRVDPEMPVTTIQPLDKDLSDSLARRRLALILLVTFAGMA